MVEDNFKIGIDLEIEQSSLADLEKQITNAIKNAAKKGAQSAGLTSPGGVGTGTVRGAAAATGVTGADFAKSIRGILKGELSGFEAAAKEITSSVNNLTSALNKQQRGGGGSAPLAPTKQTGPARASKLQDELDNLALTVIVEEKNAKEHANDLKKASKALKKAQAAQEKITRILEQEQKDAAASRAKSAKLQDAETNLIKSTEQLAAARRDAAAQTRKGAGAPAGGAAVSGPQPLDIVKGEPVTGASNRNAHKQKVNRARDAGRQESGGSLTTQPRKPHITGDGPTDRKTAAADRKGVRDYRAQAEVDAKGVAAALKEAEKAILSAIPSFKNRDLRGEFGLPSAADVRAAPGAVPTVTSPTGTENMVGMVVKMAGNTISRLDRISANLPEFKNELAAVAKAMVTNPKSGQSQLRALVKNLIGDSQKYEKHQARGQFIRGGEAQLEWKPSDAQAKQILAQGTDVGKIAEIEKIFHGIAKEAEKLNKSGLDTITLMSLTEEAAASLAVTLEQTETGFEGMVSGKVQTRPVRDLGPGGGGLVNPSRLLYQKGGAKLASGGEMPEITSSLEQMAYADGLISKAAKNLVTAAVSFKHIPEVMEDQFLIAASAAKELGMVKEKSVLVKERGEDLTKGMGLQQGQVLGSDASGKAVTMDLAGASAEITKFTDVYVDGVKMVKISFNELNEMITGAKLGDRAGHKGIAKVVPDKQLEDMGFAKGTQLVTSIEGLMKRNNLQSMVSMIATSMSDGGNVAAQTIFDSIVKAMESGEELGDSVRATAKEFGLDAGAAFKATAGALAEGGVSKVLTGRVAMFRMEKEGQTGEAPLRDRFQDPSAIGAMRQRESLSSMADAAEARSSELVVKKQKDYVYTLAHLIDASENLVAGLEKIDPESLEGFDPGGAIDPEMIKGTLLDPDTLKGAFNLQIPKKAGGFEDMYMPGQGRAAGQRGMFETEAGLIRGSDETNLLEKLRATAVQIKAARGEIDPTKDMRAQKEGAFRVSSFMDEQIEAMTKGAGGKLTSEGKEIADKFLAMWMPVIKRLESQGMKSTGLQYRTFNDTKGTERIVNVKDTPSAYIGKGGDAREQAIRIRDILGKRALGARKGNTQSIASAGALFDEENLDVVVDAMKRMGGAAQESSKYLEQLWGRFDKLKAELLDLYNTKGFGKSSGTPGFEESRKVAQTKGSGLMQGAYAKAIEFNVDVSQELEFAEKHLRSLASAGADVGDSLAALERIKSLQISEDAIPRDAVLLSKQDYNNILAMIKRDARGRGEKLTDEQARERLSRAVTHRDPTTGGGSYQIARVLEDSLGRLTEGKMGIPGAFAVSSTSDLQKVRQPMEDRREELKRIINSMNGVGPAADSAREELRTLNPVIDGLTHSFGSAMQNLDFDGDAAKVFATDLEGASSRLKTSLEILTESGMSLQQALKTIAGGIEGKDHDFQSLGGLDEAFRSIVKRPDDQRFARPMDHTAESSAIDATKLVGGKLSVGRLSDAFNILQNAIVMGARETGDAFATGLENIMQQINKSLATKHGTGDLEGPLELIDSIRQGEPGLAKIFKGMDAGGAGTFGEIGKRNKEYRKEIENQLQGQSPADLQEMALREGIADAAGMDHSSLIQKLVDSLDLKAQFRKMWKMLERNMKTSLASTGMNEGAIKAAMDDMMSDEKDPGLDLFRMQDPAYAMTRKRGAKALQKNKGGPQGIGREILKAILQDTSDDVMTQMDEFELDTSGIKSSGQNLSSEVESWLDSISSMFDVLDAQLLQSKGIDPQKALGGYAYRPSDPTGGRIQISEARRVRPAKAAVEALKRIETGQLEATPKLIGFITKALSELGMTLAHERVHEGSKRITDSVDMIAASLLSNSTAIGQARESIFKGANKLANVRVADEKFRKLEKMAQAGVTTVPDDDPQLEEFHGKGTFEAAGQQSTKYLRLVAEELQAHLTNPEKWQRIFGDIPAEAAVAISGALNQLREASPELIDPIINAVSSMNNAIVDTYAQALRGEGNDAAKQVRAQAEARIDANSFGMGPIRQRIGQFEGALAAGREARGLTPATEDETGRIKRMRDVKFAQERAMPETTGEMRKILEAMAVSGGVDTDTHANLKTQFQRHAASYKTGLKTTDSAKDAWKLHQEAMQEFQAAELEMYVNKARDLQDTIALVKASDDVDSSVLDTMIKELEKVMSQMYMNLAEARLPGTFGVTNIASDRRGMMTPQAAELGIVPGAGQYTDVIKQASGRDKDSQARFGNLANVLEDVKNGLKEDMTFTEAWVQIWDELIRQPEHMRENVGKVVEALKPMAQFMKMEKGPDKATQGLQDLAKQAQETFKILKAGAPISTMDDLNNVIARSSKLQSVANVGRPLGEVYEQEMDRIKAEARSWVKELNEILSSGVEIDAKRLSLGSREIVDPKTGTVLRKMEVGAKRVGNQFEVSMTQAGKSVNQMSGAMRGALRRVVQWGFATGIVYGTIRAFRAAANVITEVETKITALKKVMDTSVTNFDKLQDGAVGFAQEFGVAIEDVLDGMVVYGQQGLKVNKIMERTRATMLAVNVTTLSSVDATEALTAAHKVFGEEVSGSIGFVDAWAAVAARHAITAKDLADAVKRSGAAAGVAGVGFNDFLGVVTAIGAVTRQTGKEIATSTKFMFRAMRRPTAQKELGKMGVQSLTPGGDFKPALGILKEVAGSWDSMTRAQQVNLAQEMAGIRHYNSFIVLMNNFDEALLASADAANSQGFAMRKNRLAMGTFTKNMNQLKETAKGLAIELGNVLLPIGTGIIELMTKMGKAVGSLPPIVLQATTLFAGMGLALHKGADLISDSMEAMSTGNIDIDPDKMTLGRRIGGGMKSMGEGWRAAGALDGTREGLTKMGKASFFAKKGLIGAAQGAGALISMVPGLKGVGAALAMGGALAGGLVLAALAAAVAGLVIGYQHLTKSAKQYEQEQEKIIGRSEDAASKLRAQKTTADRLTLSYHKIGKAQEAMNDPQAMQAALQEGRFKGTAKAAQDYANMLSEVSNNMAELDPSSVRGITESGDYIMGIADNFKALTTSALDSRNAITAALKLDVINKFAEELNTAEGFWDNFKQKALEAADAVGLATATTEQGDEAFSVMGKLGDARKEIQRITDAMAEQEASGEYSLDLQLQLNSAVENEVALRKEAAGTAANIRRILESIPRFEDMDFAMDQIDDKAFQNISGAARAGAFGRGSTGESVMTQFAARQAGLGGIVDYQAAQSPALIANAFLERGIRGVGGSGAVSGTADKPATDNEIAILSKKAADQLSNGVRVLFTDVDKASGELSYRFRSKKGEWERIAASTVEGTISGLESAEGEIANHFHRFATKEVEAAAESTKKMLTLQFAGAMAGIRVPTGGMPDLGPARAADLTAEQRVMSKMPEDLQRLADVQQEFNQLAKEYSEEVLTDVEGAYRRQAKSGTAFKVMTQEVYHLAQRLQTEGHLITVMGNFRKVSAELEIALEAAAEAARDASREEENRAKFIKTTSGALAGMGELPNLDLGKSMRELTGQERLARSNPAVERMMRKIAGTERQRDADLQVLNDIQARMARFDDIKKSLEEAGDRLSGEQQDRIGEAALRDATPGEMEMIKALMEEGSKAQDIGQQQLSVQHKMLETLGITNELLSLPEKERAGAFAKHLAGADFKKTSASFMQMAGMSEWRKVIEDVVGLSTSEDGRAGSRVTATSDTEQARQLASLFNSLEMFTEMERSHGGSTGQIAVGPDGDIIATADQAEEALNEFIEALFAGSEELRGKFKGKVVDLTSASSFQEQIKKAKIEESEERAAASRTKIAEISAKVQKELLEAEAKQVMSLEAANKELQQKEGFRLAVAVSDFAKSLDDIVLEMEKATMMGEGVKVDSDLDPDFGRVGQPGFKSSFDQRREALESGSNRPMTLDQMRQRDQDRKQLDFDEKEAEIKKKQAVETAALRQIQQQAEKVRDVLATTALDPSIDQGTRDLAQSYFDQLSEELTTSEQAVENRDGTASFRGVPALNELKKFAAQMQQRSKDQAAKASRENQTAAVRDGVGGLQTTASQQLAVQKAMLNAMTGGRGTDFVEAPDTGTTAAGTHSQVAGTPRVDFSSGSSVTSAGTGGGDLRREGLTGQFLNEVRRVYGPKQPGFESEQASMMKNIGESDLATGEGANIAGVFTVLAATLKNQSSAIGKASQGIDTAFGRVVTSVEEGANGFVTAYSRLETVTKAGRAAGFEKGDSVLSQEFSVTDDADGVRRARAGHIGTEGLPEELRGHGIGRRQSAAAGEALQRMGVRQVLSTEAPAKNVKGMYDAMAEATGGRSVMSAGAQLVPESAGGHAYIDPVTGGSPLGVEMPTRAAAEAARYEDATSQFHVKSQSLKMKEFADSVNAENAAQAQRAAAHAAAESAAAADPWGPGAPMGESGLAAAEGKPGGSRLSALVDKYKGYRSTATGAFDGSKMARLGKGLGAAGVGLDAYMMADTMVGAESAQTPEELKQHGAKLGGQVLGTAGVMSLMTTAGMATGGNPWAIGGAGVVGGAGMIADHFAGAGSLDYAGKWWDDKSGGMISKGAQMGGKALMAPGNIAGDIADWWNTRGVDMGPGASAPTAAMPGATPPPAAAPKKKDWNAIVQKKLEEDRVSKLYSADQLERWGADDGLQVFGSAASRAKGDYISKGLSGKSSIPMRDLQGPGTLIPEEVLQGSGSLNLNEYLQRMQDSRAAQAPPLPAGPSGRRQGLDQQAQHDHLQSVTPAAATPDQRDTARELSNNERERESGGNEKLASAIEALNSRLEGIGDITLDTTDITAGLSTVTQAVTALGSQTLNVSISNSVPLDVNVTSLPAGALTSTSDAGAAGADVTQLATVVQNLAGLEELHRQDIAANRLRLESVENVNTQQSSDIATLQTDTQGLDANTISNQIASEVATAATTIQGEVSTAIGVVDGKISPLDQRVTEARQIADEASQGVTDFQSSLTTATDTATAAKIAAEAATKESAETKIVATEAKNTATAAQTEASDATQAVRDLTQTVNANKQNIESQVRDVKTAAGDNTVNITANTKEIRRVAGLVATAQGTADAANARSNQR